MGRNTRRPGKALEAAFATTFDSRIGSNRVAVPERRIVLRDRFFIVFFVFIELEFFGLFGWLTIDCTLYTV